MGLVLVAIVPLLLFGAGVAVKVIEQKKAAIAAELKSTASALRVAVDHELLSQFTAMEILATEAALDAGNLPAFAQRARRAVASHREWYNLALIDPVSRTLLAAATPLPTPAPTTLAPDAVAEVVELQKPKVVGLFPSGRITKRPVVLFYFPVMRQGSVPFVLSVAMDPKRLSGIFAEHQLAPDWTGAVVDSRMLIAGRSRDPERFVGVRATSTLTDHILASDHGMFTALNQEGDSVYTVFSRSPVTDWSVVIGVPAEAVEAPIRALLAQLAAAAGVLTVLALACTAAVGFQIVRRRNAYERALAEFNRDFETFLENTNDFVFFKDGNSRFRFCSQPLAKITGHAHWRDMRGKNDLDVFPADVARVYAAEEVPVFENGMRLLDKVDPYYNESGQLRYVLTNKLPLFDESGKVVGIFGISHDITDRMARQTSLEREVCERTEQLRAMALELTNAEERERETIAQDLHDGLGQILAVAKLKMSGTQPLGQRDIEEVEKLLDKANQLVRSLSLQLGPPATGSGLLIPALEWLAENLRTSHGLQVNVFADRSPNIDNEAVFKVLLRATRELLINVAKHAHVDTADLTIMHDNDSVVISISDAGTGFDAAHLPAPSAKGGYGLCSVRKRIGLLGGDVQIDSRVGDGTVVVLTLPLKQGHD